MMEESVPLASSTNRSQVQQRSAAPRNSSSNNAATTSTASTATTNNDDINDHDDRSTRRRHHSSSLLSPTFLLSKLIFIITIAIKILLYPLRKLSHAAFPRNAFDGLAIDGVADSAASVFVKMFLTSYITPRYGETNTRSNGNNNTNTNSNTNSNITSDSDSDEDNEQELLTSCPFTTKGYSNTIQQIATQTFSHQTAITNMTTISEGTGVMNPMELESPPPLLLVYLHSPFHASTHTFCSQKLCSNRILTFLNDQVTYQHQLICWGGSIHTADGKNVASMMKVTAYPFMALVRVRPQSGSSSSNSSSNSSNGTNANGENNNNVIKSNLEIYLRMEGHNLSTINTNTLHTYISRSIQEYSQLQNEDISRKFARQEEINLRNEQDREYHQALADAQTREREREEEEKRKKEEERLQVEELNRVVMEKENKLTEARRILGLYGQEEPDGKNKEDNCASIRLTLPSGKKVERKFRGKDTVDTLKSFLILQFEDNDTIAAEKIENFQLNCKYPRKALVDGNATLEGEGLCPQAVIMVQDLDA